jgi:hypothetical protein
MRTPSICDTNDSDFRTWFRFDTWFRNYAEMQIPNKKNNNSNSLFPCASCHVINHVVPPLSSPFHPFCSLFHSFSSSDAPFAINYDTDFHIWHLTIVVFLLFNSYPIFDLFAILTHILFLRRYKHNYNFNLKIDITNI